MLIHLVADYGSNDLAFAEVVQRLHLVWNEHDLGELQVHCTSVPPFDTVSAGFIVAQLALTPGPTDRLVYHNVAPRRDDAAPRLDNSGEILCAGQTAAGIWVVGVNAGHAFSLVRPSLNDLRAVDTDNHGTQFRSRDLYPDAIGRLLTGQPLRGSEACPDVHELTDRVLYTDGYGNVKTAINDFHFPPGTPITISMEHNDRHVEREGVVSGAGFAVEPGSLALSAGSSGFPIGDEHVEFHELFLRGGSAAKLFEYPPAGTLLQVSQRH